MHDQLIQDLQEGKEGALILLDQSKTYDLVDHVILIEKMRIPGFHPQALKILQSFLSNRQKYVQVKAKTSDKLLIGPNSVIQGSTLSCVLYLMYILDLPEIFHSEKHSPEEYRNCSKTNVKTFVDDGYLRTLKKEDKTLKELIKETMEKWKNTQERTNCH